METRTPGSVGGSGKRTSRKADTAPRPDPTRSASTDASPPGRVPDPPRPRCPSPAHHLRRDHPPSRRLTRLGANRTRISRLVEPRRHTLGRTETRPESRLQTGPNRGSNRLPSAPEQHGHQPQQACPKACGQLPMQCSAALDTARLMDRLMGNTHRLVIGEVNAQSTSDLLRACRPYLIASGVTGVPTAPVNLITGALRKNS